MHLNARLAILDEKAISRSFCSLNSSMLFSKMNRIPFDVRGSFDLATITVSAEIGNKGKQRLDLAKSSVLFSSTLVTWK